MTLSKDTKLYNRNPHPCETLRRKILVRDNYTCQLCGLYGNTVDHIKPPTTEKGYDNRPTNLRCLCRTCNNIVTRRQRRDARLNLPDYFKLLAELRKATDILAGGLEKC